MKTQGPGGKVLPLAPPGPFNPTGGSAQTADGAVLPAARDRDHVVGRYEVAVFEV
jgi:hypothetical protein